MSNKIPTYSSRNLKITWTDHDFMALAPDGLEITPTSEVTEEEAGMDGSVQISMLPDETGAAMVRLQQNSPTNNYLALVLQKQRQIGDIVTSDMTISDPSGSVICEVIGAHIKSKPTISRGNTATGVTMDWNFFATEVRYLSVDASNGNAATIIADVLAGENIDTYFQS